MSVLNQLLFTPKCVICSKLGVDFCYTCVENVKPFRARDLTEIEACFCAGEYSSWLRDSIICYKNGDRNYTELLSFLLTKTLEKHVAFKSLTLVPIPSANQKIKERGFDSIANLCSSLSRRHESIKIDNQNLYLRRTVIDQVGLSAAQRFKNLDGAFGAQRSIRGSVLIVDDVITTGATLISAAKTLRLAGAQRVFALALCGTPKTR